MKILQINASYKPAYTYGGPTMSVAKLSEQLVKAGFTLEVFTTTANGQTELAVDLNTMVEVDGVPVTYFKRITKDHTHFSPALLKKLWHDVPGFDIVHIHAWWNLVSVLSALIALIRKKKVVISPRGTLSSYSFYNRNNLTKKLIHNLLGKPLLNRSYIHTTTKAEQVDIAKIIKPKAFFTIPNFVQFSQPILIQKTTDAPIFKLLFLSRIEEKKGLEILLNALPLINIPYHLTIAGDGDKAYIKQLKKIAYKNKIENHVTWIGFQNETKFTILQDNHLLVLPSYNENFGNVVIESLSVGTAVLISEQVGLATYVTENNLGWLCQTNSRSVSEAINIIATDHRDQLLYIKKSASAIIQNDFNEDKLVKMYIAMYKQIISHD